MALTPGLDAFASAVGGSLGGGIATASLYPLDTLRSMIASQAKAEGAVAVAKRVLKEQGPSAFYRGFRFKLFKSMYGKLLYFYAYSYFQNLHKDLNDGQISIPANLAYGYLAEWMHAPMTQPADVICTRMQSGATTGEGGVLSVLTGVYAKEGIKGFYKGIGALPVLCLQPAIQFTIFDTVKKQLTKKGATLSAVRAFWLGAVARGVAICIIYPYLKAKTIMQTRKKTKGEAGAPPAATTITGVLQSVIAQDGFTALYTGLKTELIRAVLSSALMFMLKEKVYEGVRIALRALFKTSTTLS